MGLLQVDGVASRVLQENGVVFEKLVDLVNQLIAPSSSVEIIDGGSFTPRFKHIVDQSHKEAAKLKAQETGTEHLLIALLRETDCIAVRLLSTLGVNIQKIYVDILAAAGVDINMAKNDFVAGKGKQKAKSATPTLDQSAGPYRICQGRQAGSGNRQGRRNTKGYPDIKQANEEQSVPGRGARCGKDGYCRRTCA